MLCHSANGATRMTPPFCFQRSYLFVVFCNVVRTLCLLWRVIEEVSVRPDQSEATRPRATAARERKRKLDWHCVCVRGEGGARLRCFSAGDQRHTSCLYSILPHQHMFRPTVCPGCSNMTPPSGCGPLFGNMFVFVSLNIDTVFFPFSTSPHICLIQIFIQ